MSAGPRPRRASAPAGSPSASAEPASPVGPITRPKAREKPPFLLDFFPLETENDTRLFRFYERLREGRLSTTRCPADGRLSWPPRTACPQCHSERLDWVDLPEGGRLYAFSAVLTGAPLGMEDEVPFAVGLVDLDGVPLRLFGRIEGKPWNELHIGQKVRAEAYDVGDGRVFYRFRVDA